MSAATSSSFRTSGGATVDVRPRGTATEAKCGGCGRYDTTHWDSGPWGSGAGDADRAARAWAEDHAKSCQAGPR